MKLDSSRISELLQEPTFILLRCCDKDQVQTSVQVYTAHAATTTTARWPADRQHKLWLQMMSADVYGSLGKMLRVEFRTRGVNFKQR